MIRGKEGVGGGAGLGEGQMKQKVFVTHYEAQIPLVDHRGVTMWSMNPSQPEHQYFLVWKNEEGTIHSSARIFQLLQHSEVTRRLVYAPLPSPARNAEHEAELGYCQDRVSPKAS